MTCTGKSCINTYSYMNARVTLIAIYFMNTLEKQQGRTNIKLLFEVVNVVKVC